MHVHPPLPRGMKCPCTLYDLHHAVIPHRAWLQCTTIYAFATRCPGVMSCHACMRARQRCGHASLAADSQASTRLLTPRQTARQGQPGRPCQTGSACMRPSKPCAAVGKSHLPPLYLVITSSNWVQPSLCGYRPAQHPQLTRCRSLTRGHQMAPTIISACILAPVMYPSTRSSASDKQQCHQIPVRNRPPAAKLSGGIPRPPRFPLSRPSIPASTRDERSRARHWTRVELAQAQTSTSASKRLYTHTHGLGEVGTWRCGE